MGVLRSLEINVLSAENIRFDGKSVKKDSFVVVGVDHQVNLKSTKADHEGGSNPTWNEKLGIDMPMHARFISLQVQCKIGSGNRVIGIANIPVSDFVNGYTPQNYLHFLSYRLRDLKGKKNGIINVSVKIKGLADAVKNNLPTSSSELGLSPPTWGLPAREKKNHYGGGGVVTGVPVWCASRA